MIDTAPEERWGWDCSSAFTRSAGRATPEPRKRGTPNGCMGHRDRRTAGRRRGTRLGADHGRGLAREEEGQGRRPGSKSSAAGTPAPSARKVNADTCFQSVATSSITRWKWFGRRTTREPASPSWSHPAQRFGKPLAIHLVLENRNAPVALIHAVKNRAKLFAPNFAGDDVNASKSQQCPLSRTDPNGP